jgi:tRNA-binding protein
MESDFIELSDFLKIDIRIGEIISAEVFKEAKKPAYILMINFGPEIGLKKSSAQITENYNCQELIGKKVAAVVNLASRQIGPIKSEVLTLGFSDSQGKVVLFSPDKEVPNGAKLH